MVYCETRPSSVYMSGVHMRSRAGMVLIGMGLVLVAMMTLVLGGGIGNQTNVALSTTLVNTLSGALQVLVGALAAALGLASEKGSDTSKAIGAEKNQTAALENKQTAHN